MRRIVLLMLLVIYGTFPYSAISQGIPLGSVASGSISHPVVQYCDNANFGTTVTCANFTVGALTSGNILVGFGYAGTAATLTTTMSGCGLTWTTQSSGTSAGKEFIATAPITSTATCTGASRPTISGTGTSADIVVDVMEVVSASQAVDGTPTFNTATPTSNFNGPSITPGSNGDSIITFEFENSTNAFTVQSPFNAVNNDVLFSTSYIMAGSYNVQATAAAIHASYTYSSSIVTMVGGIIAIKP